MPAMTARHGPVSHTYTHTHTCLYFSSSKGRPKRMLSLSVRFCTQGVWGTYEMLPPTYTHTHTYIHV